MSKIAFIYPGQGAQVCGMGQDFYEQTKEGKEEIWEYIDYFVKEIDIHEYIDSNNKCRNEGIR